MKRLFLFLLLAGISGNLFAQNKLTRYCEVKTLYLNFKQKNVRIELQETVVDSLFSPLDSSVKRNLSMVKTLKREPDLLNYMDKIGWSLVSIVGEANGITAFYFKREFEASELKGAK